MSYDLPSASDFKTRLPEFASREDELVSMFLQAAADEGVVPEVWSERDYRVGVIFLAAHFLSLYIGALRAAATAGSGGTGGTSAEISTFCNKIKFEGFEVNFAEGKGSSTSSSSTSNSGSASDSFLSRTSYGAYFSRLLQRNVFPGMIL